MKILVTGGAGFIGSHIVETLLADPRVSFVRVLDNLATGNRLNIELFMDNPKFEFMWGDIREYNTCFDACKDMDLITHQAALGSVPRSIKQPLTTNNVNIGGTLNIFEDGEIVRDFVHVSDVVAAFHLLCESEQVPTMTIDIGSGQRETILDVAKLMIGTLGLEGDRFTISGQFRPGDIRHALADIADAKSLLGWAPKVSLQTGVAELLDWARSTL